MAQGIFFFMVKTASQFPKANVKNIALKVLENNAYFTLPEMVTLAMLGDESDTVRDQAVSNILYYNFVNTPPRLGTQTNRGRKQMKRRTIETKVSENV